MNKKNIVKLVKIVIIITLIFLFVYSFFYGSPFKKIISEINTSIYLKEKYDKDFKVNEVYFNFDTTTDESGYYASASTIDIDGNVHYTIVYSKNVFNRNGYFDTYISALLGFEAEKELKVYLQDFFDGNTIFDVILYDSSDRVLELMGSSTVPLSYFDIKDETNLYIDVFIEGAYSDKSEVDRLNQIYNTLEVIKRQKHNLYQISFRYDLIENSNDEVRVIEVSGDDLYKIKNVDDLERFWKVRD